MLLCGVGGFIGRNIFETLSKRDDLEVFGIYCKNKPSLGSSNLIQADLRMDSQVRSVTREVDVLIHAAAVTAGSKAVSQRPHEFITDNVMMNTLLWQAAHENHIPQVIFMSCTVMYPNIDRPVKETDTVFEGELHPAYFGGAWVKIFAEKLAQFYAGQGRTRFTAIRHSNIYGPYDKYDLERAHVFGATMTKVLTSKNGKVVVQGEGNAERDLLHVSDLVRFVEMAMEKQKSPFEVFNVGLGEAISVKNLVKKIIAQSGKKLAIEYDKSKPTIDTKLVLDIRKAQEKIGWVPRVRLEEGIQKTIEWYKLNYL